MNDPPLHLPLFFFFFSFSGVLGVGFFNTWPVTVAKAIMRKGEVDLRFSNTPEKVGKLKEEWREVCLLTDSTPRFDPRTSTLGVWFRLTTTTVVLLLCSHYLCLKKSLVVVVVISLVVAVVRLTWDQNRHTNIVTKRGPRYVYGWGLHFALRDTETESRFSPLS